MGDQRTRMILGGALSGGSQGFLNQRANDEDERLRQEGIAREDQLLADRRAREDSENERLRQERMAMQGMTIAGQEGGLGGMIRSNPEMARSMGLQDLRRQQREQTQKQRGIRQEAGATRDELRGLREEDRGAFQEAGGRDALQTATRQAKKPENRQKAGLKGKESVQAALESLKSATTSVELQDRLTQLEGTPEAKRPAVRKQINNAQKRLEDLRKAESTDQTRALDRAGRGADSAQNKAFDPQNYGAMVSGMTPGQQGSERNRTMSQVQRIQKDYAGMASSARNAAEVAKRDGAHAGVNAIMLTYQFLKSQDDSVVREGEIRLLEAAQSWSANARRLLENLQKTGGRPSEDDMRAILTETEVNDMKELGEIMSGSAETAYLMQLKPYETQYQYWFNAPPPNLYQALGISQAPEDAPAIDLTPERADELATKYGTPGQG